MILGASILQLPAIKKAKEMGLDVVVVDMNADAIGFKEKGIEKEVISTIDVEKVLESAKKHKINGILTIASDMPMRTVAIVCDELKLNGISYQTSINATDKYQMRLALKKSNVPIPLFFEVSTFEDYCEVIKRFDNCFLTKPADNSGSRGVFLVTKSEDYDKAFKYSKSFSRNGNIMVEEYMEGPEVSVETISINGECYVIQITDKITTKAPYFVEIGHTQPSMLNDDIKKQISDVAIAANKAIGIKNGPSHTEIIITKNGPKIVEIGARLGGDCINSHLVPLSTGVDMVEACIRIALGEVPNINKTLNKGSAIRYIGQHKGLIVDISGIENAKRIPGVKEVFLNYQKGDQVDNIKNSSSRIGFVISQGSDAVAAANACEEALKKIRISIV